MNREQKFQECQGICKVGQSCMPATHEKKGDFDPDQVWAPVPQSLDPAFAISSKVHPRVIKHFPPAGMGLLRSPSGEQKRPFSTQCHGSFESFQKDWHDTEQPWDHSKPQQGHCQPLQNPAFSTMLKMTSEHIWSLLQWISIPKTSFSL